MKNLMFLATVLMMPAATREVSQAERKEVADELTEEQGTNVSPSDVDEEDVLELEELAALYVQTGGTDPRALKIVNMAKAAGRIDESGNWIDPDIDDEG